MKPHYLVLVAMLGATVAFAKVDSKAAWIAIRAQYAKPTEFMKVMVSVSEIKVAKLKDGTGGDLQGVRFTVARSADRDAIGLSEMPMVALFNEKDALLCIVEESLVLWPKGAPKEMAPYKESNHLDAKKHATH